jgi:hypothetical protein
VEIWPGVGVGDQLFKSRALCGSYSTSQSSFQSPRFFFLITFARIRLTSPSSFVSSSACPWRPDIPFAIHFLVLARSTGAPFTYHLRKIRYHSFKSLITFDTLGDISSKCTRLPQLSSAQWTCASRHCAS